MIRLDVDTLKSELHCTKCKFHFKLILVWCETCQSPLTKRLHEIVNDVRAQKKSQTITYRFFHFPKIESKQPRHQPTLAIMSELNNTRMVRRTILIITKLTAIQGAKTYDTPVARVSRAVAAPIRATRAGSLQQTKMAFKLK